MAPTLRSQTVTSVTDHQLSPSRRLQIPSTPNRKVPCCRQCGRPRAGHPRRGCPFAVTTDDATATPEAATPSTSRIDPPPSRILERELSNAFDRLEIEKENAFRTVPDTATPTPTASPSKSSPVAVARRKSSTSLSQQSALSILSLSTDSGEVARMLLATSSTSSLDESPGSSQGSQGRPSTGIFRPYVPRKSECEAAAAAATAAAAAATHGPRASTPTSSSWSNSQNSQKTEVDTHDHSRCRSAPRPSQDSQDSNATQQTEPLSVIEEEMEQQPMLLSTITGGISLSSRSSRSPRRSMTSEQRELFLDGLQASSRSAPATLYRYSAEEVDAVVDAAITYGFIARTIEVSEIEDVYVVIGRDAREVDRVYKAFYESDKRAASMVGRIGAAAGGAFVGAVITFSTLAFS